MSHMGANKRTNSEMEVRLFLNPVGELHIEYGLRFAPRQRPPSELRIPTTRYVYDYHKLSGITFPLGKIVRTIRPTDVSVKQDILKSEPKLEVQRTGEYHILLPLDPKKVRKHREVQVGFMIPNIVNRDALFHTFVYAIVPPNNVAIDNVNIETKAHFAQGIRSFNSTAKKFSAETGQFIKNVGFSTKKLVGDIIKTKLRGKIKNDEEIDIHLTAAHLPKIAVFGRYRFWAFIWVSIFLLLIWSFLT